MQAASVPLVTSLTCSRKGVLFPFRRVDGSKIRFAMSATTPTITIAMKAARQPHCCPIKVPKGTPVTVATVSPENIMEMALARRSLGTRSAAMVEPMDMNTPWENAETTRAISSMTIPPENAARLLPAINTIMIHSSSVLRGTLDVNEVKTGAPMVTPKAYNVTVKADMVTDMCKSSAIRGSSPTLMNSVVPMAKALTAKASNGTKYFVLSLTTCLSLLSLFLPVEIFDQQMLL